MAKVITARLHQQEGTHGIRLFELYDDRFLRVRLRPAANKLIEYAMDIAILSPQVQRMHRRPWHWLIAAGVAAAAMLVCALVLLLAFSGAYTGPLLLATVALFWATAACGALFYFRSAHTLVFASRYAGVPLVELRIGRPTARACNEFISHLSARIGALVESKDLTTEDLRAGEMRNLRKLSEQGVIDNEVYEQAKQRLLALQT